MTASDSSDAGPSKRTRIKELRLQLKAELKLCKDKAQIKTIEAKYAELELKIKESTSAPVVAPPEPDSSEIKWTVTEKGVSDKQKKREEKRKKEEAERDAIREATKDNKLHNEREMAGIAAQIDLYRKRFSIFENLEIRAVPSDGSCLFSAVASHAKELSDPRGKVAARLRSHRAEYEAFVDENFDQYVDRIATDAWGGELELRVLSDILGRPIVVFRRDDFRVIGPENFDKSTAVTISFHELQFACPHYNAVHRKF